MEGREVVKNVHIYRTGGSYIQSKIQKGKSIGKEDKRDGVVESEVGGVRQ